jgi:hypothetical protein
MDLFECGYWVSWPNPPRTADGDGFDSALGDLLVLTQTGPVGIEVKGRSIDFSGPHDFPFDLAVVGGIRRWAARADDPSFVVLASNGSLAGRLVVPVRTKSRWERVTWTPEPCWGAPRSCWKSWGWLVERFRHPTV